MFDGKLYPGFGDYGANTGPLDVVPLDLTTQTFSGVEVTLQAEETFRMRILDGVLHVPYLDPQGTNADPENGQLAVTAGGGVWNIVTTVTGLTHAFDVAKTVDGLWLFGSDETTDNATVWRSADDGATWVKSLEIAPDGGAASGETRFYAAAQIGDDLTGYYHSGTVDRAYHWNGSTWVEVDSPGTIYGVPAVFDYNGTPFAVGISTGAELAVSGQSGPTVLTTLADAAEQAAIQASLPPTAIYDAYTAGGVLWLLASDFSVWRGDTAGVWTRYGPLDDGTIRCLAVANGYLYFGTTDSRILRTPIPS